MNTIIHPNRWFIWTIVSIIVYGALIMWFVELYSIQQEIAVTENSAPITVSNRSSNKNHYDISKWKTYRNEEYGFEVEYPGDSEPVSIEEGIRINLPFAVGTNLSEKYLQVLVRDVNGGEECSNPARTMIRKTETVNIVDLESTKEMGSDGATGSIYDSVSYSIVKDNRCFGLSFVLHSVNPGVFDNPPPVYDKEKESEIFDNILSTFKFIPLSSETGQVEPIDTSEWNELIDETYKISLKYPPNWSAEQISQKYLSPQIGKFVEYVFKPNSKDIPESISARLYVKRDTPENIRATFRDFMGGGDRYEEFRQHKGEMIMFYSESFEGVQSVTYYALSSRLDKVAHLSFSIGYGRQRMDYYIPVTEYEKEWEVFQQILPTFKFIE